MINRSTEEQHLSEIEIFCNIINVFIITFEHIIMISEGSCDWRNDAENSALITGINENIFK